MDTENCLVCLDILFEPHHALPCKHLFCKLCFKQIKVREITCPYCRQSIESWKYNRDKAIKVKKAHPEKWKEKLKEEKAQKLPPKKLPLGTFDQFLLLIPFISTVTDFVLFIVGLVSFWIYSLPLINLIGYYMSLMFLNTVTQIVTTGIFYVRNSSFSSSAISHTIKGIHTIPIRN